MSDSERAFVARYFTFMREDAAQRESLLRALFNSLRWIAEPAAYGGASRMTSRFGRPLTGKSSDG
ncbi:MAG: hypothetical protein AAGI68_00340 [Planctomycetota bacterium]